MSHEVCLDKICYAVLDDTAQITYCETYVSLSEDDKIKVDEAINNAASIIQEINLITS